MNRSRLAWPCIQGVSATKRYSWNVLLEMRHLLKVTSMAASCWAGPQQAPRNRGCSSLVIGAPGSFLPMRFACMYKIDMETAKSSFFSTYIPQRPIQNSHSSLPKSNIGLLSNNAFLRVHGVCVASSYTLHGSFANVLAWLFVSNVRHMILFSLASLQRKQAQRLSLPTSAVKLCTGVGSWAVTCRFLLTVTLYF